LELLVVIGIIGVLATIGFSSYSTAQKKARDAKIKGDMQAMQNGLEQYYSTCGFAYPTPGGPTSKTLLPIVCTTPPATIMPTIPVNPKTGSTYVYTVSGTTYTLCVGVTPAFEAEAFTGDYCLTNQQ
jgi:type II secretory pathway pseudopilin PulG